MTRYQSKFSRGCGSAAAILLIILFLHPISLRAQALSDLDALRYIASHPDLIQAYGADANKGRSHYETWGKKEGRTITFNPLNYTASHPDLIAAFGTDQVKATTHYIQWGYKEGRQTTFSPFAYIASYIDLIRAFGADAIAGAKHFIEYGLREGRRIVFDALTYINTYADLRAVFGTDTNAGAKHYIEWGVNERRTALAPTVVWTPPFVEFDNQSKSVQEIPVAIQTTTELRIKSITFVEGATTSFKVTNASFVCDFRNKCLIRVNFNPTSLNTKIAIMRIESNAIGSPHDIKLVGRIIQIGDVRDLPAQDACDLKQRRPDVPNRGVFWFRGSEYPRQPLLREVFQTQVLFDFPREGDCWSLMRRVPGVGNWYPSNDDLQGRDTLNTDYATTVNAVVPWALPFYVSNYYEGGGSFFTYVRLTFLFVTGDESAWCIIESLNDEKIDGESDLHTHKWRNQKYAATYSVGNGVVKGEATVTVNERLQTPTINCGGQVFYSESGDTEAVAFKNARGGINVYLHTQVESQGGG